MGGRGSNSGLINMSKPEREKQDIRYHLEALV